MLDNETMTKLERLAHGELPLSEVRLMRQAVREDEEMREAFRRIREEDRMITESLLRRLAGEPTPAFVNKQAANGARRTLARSVLSLVSKRVCGVRVSWAAVVMLVAACVLGSSFAAGYAVGRDAGTLGPEDVRAVKGVAQEYIEAAKRGDLQTMYQLSDQRWRQEHTAAELTRADRRMLVSDLVVGEEVRTTWGEKPCTSVPLFLRRGSGGMALAFFVVRQGDRWLVNRSQNAAAEAAATRHMMAGGELCTELVETDPERFQKDGYITIPYEDLSESQRVALQRFFGMVDESGALTEFGRRITDLEQATIRIEHRHKEKVVIRLLTPSRDDLFLAADLQGWEETPD